MLTALEEDSGLVSASAMVTLQPSVTPVPEGLMPSYYAVGTECVYIQTKHSHIK